MKEKFIDKVKRGLKKIEEISDNTEKAQNIKDEIINTFKSKIEDYKDPINLLKDLNEELRDIDYSDIKHLTQKSKQEKLYVSKLKHSIRFKEIDKPYDVNIAKFSKFQPKKRIKLPKLDEKNRSKLLKLKKNIDIIRCPICQYSVSSINARFCKNCGQKLLIYRGIEDYDKAINILKHSLKNELEDYYTLMDLGSLYYNKANYRKAIKAYEKFLKINPNEEIIFTYLGIAYYKISKYKKAIKAFKNASQINPNNSTIKAFLGLAYGLNEKYDKAIKTCREAIEINSRDKFAWNNIGFIYNLKGEYDLAIETSNRAIDCDLGFSDSWNNLGFAYLSMGNYSESFNSLYKSIKYNPYYSIAWKNLGILYYGLGHYKFALEAYWYSIELEPKDCDTWYNLARLYYRQEDYNKAIEANIICLKINSNFSKAIKLFEKILESEKSTQSNHYAWYFLAKIHDNHKKYHKSLEACQNSLKIENNFKKALKLRKKLQKHF